MDGSTPDHSDSDSGDSWTLLEHNPVYGDDAPEFSENNPIHERGTAEINAEKDEDTDGISVISDSEPELSTPCEINFDKCLTQENRPAELQTSQFISLNPQIPNINHDHESVRAEDDFLGDNTGKHKTYVHRRNKRISTVLNIIMLGSVITAAGVAIGHMWGARNECSIHTTPSINKILSNLYKLQEENAYLRNKLKELTQGPNNLHIQQRKQNSEKITFKQQRCKKLYEEPLDSKNIERVTKCISYNENSDDKVLDNHMVQPEYEKEFIKDIDKLKNIYQQNKSWLDDEVAKRMKREQETLQKMVNNMRSPLSSISEEQKGMPEEPTKRQFESDSQIDVKLDTEQPIQLDSANSNVANESPQTPIKVTYADSLKSDQHSHIIKKREINTVTQKENKDQTFKRKNKKDKDMIYDVLSEEEFKKDDRYIGHRTKLEKKKRDRQKLHKKMKRRNKYEQWEMKGGYMKDYDEFSLTSSQENVLKKIDNNLINEDTEKRKYKNQLSETDDVKINNSKNDKLRDRFSTKTDKASGKSVKNEDLNWFDKRAVLRTEARKKLEYELFGETSPNNAGWYFRRMQRREQCRAKGDNSTYKKLSRRNMNFKMKH